MLKLANKFSLPLEVAGEANGIVATRGAGKSFTSAVIVEELYRAGIQFCVLDPTGVYWGLRAAANGKDQGLPVIVLGGAHGDVPLEPTAGSLIADLLVDTGQSLILDLSDFPTKAAQTRFVTDFAERLYRRKARARTTLHVVLDEAEEFAPQKPMRDEARMLGAMETLVKRGRSRGVGVTLITQRTASLNKNVLDLIDTLIAMRIGSPRDRKAVDGWITVKHAEDKLGVIDTLPSLKTGTAWVWSPVRGILEQIQVRRIRTFDSYATPKPGEKRIEPKKLAPIDINKLGEQIQDTLDKKKAEDPKELQKQVADLKRKLQHVERECDRYKKQAEKKPKQNNQAPSAGVVSAEVTRLEQTLSRIRDQADKALQKSGQSAIHVRHGNLKKDAGVQRETRQRETWNSELPAGERSVLIVCGQYPDGATRDQITVLTGYKRSTRDTYIRRLKDRDYVTDQGGGQVVITDAGRQALGNDYEPLPTGKALQDYWLDRLPEGERAILAILLNHAGQGCSRDHLTDSTGYKRSTRDTYIRRLTARQLVNARSDGYVEASGILFES